MLEEPLLRRLDAFSLVLRAHAQGGAGGLRRSKALGSSVEFSDFRSYAAGDDLRRVDWNAYARFDKLFLKLFLEEQEVCLRILIDASASMAEGEPSKWVLTQKLAAILAYLALTRYDRVMLVALSGGGVSQSPVFAGRQAYPRAIQWLEALVPGGKTRLNAALARVPSGSGRGLCVLLSDLLCEEGWDTGAASLLYHKQEVAVLQVLSPQEMQPTLTGAVRLIDCEGEPARDVHITPDALRGYEAALSSFLMEQRAFCHKRGMTYQLLRSDMDIERDVLRALIQSGFVTSR